MVGWSVISFLWGILKTMNRAQHAAPVAQELGFTYTPWMGPEATPRFATSLFQKDRGATLKNVMTGNYAGLETQLFDYSCTTGSVQHSTTTCQTVVVYTQNVDLPWFLLEPKSLADKLLDALEHQNVELDCPPGLRLHYTVRGLDKARVCAFFDGRRIRLIENLDRNQGWHIEGAGKTLVLYRYARKVKPAELKDFLQETSAIAQSFLAGAAAAGAR